MKLTIEIRDDWRTDVLEAFDGDSNDREHDLLYEIFAVVSAAAVETMTPSQVRQEAYRLISEERVSTEILRELIKPYGGV